MALVVKTPPASAGNLRHSFRLLGLEDPLEGSQRECPSMATCSSILDGKFSQTEELGGYGPRGCKETDITEVTQHDS